MPLSSVSAPHARATSKSLASTHLSSPSLFSYHLLHGTCTSSITISVPAMQPRTSNAYPQSNFGSASPAKTRPPPASAAFSGNGSVAIDAGLLNSILDRLEKLETSNHLPGNAEHRLAALEQSMEDTRRKCDNSLAEVQDLQRVTMQLGNQITRQGGLLEVLQQDVDARRSVVSRMDSWARQGEIWRDDMEGQLTTINRQIKDVTKGVKEVRERNGPGLGDIDTLKEKLSLQTQQTVAATLSVWHDKIESSVKSVERQVAALRIGATIGGDGHTELSEMQIKEAMTTQQPSELLVKAMVDSALRDVEKDLEAGVTGRVRADLKSEQVDNLSLVKKDMQILVNQMASDAGLAVSGSDGTTTTKESLARQAMAARKAQERELELMSTKFEDLSAAVAMLQEASDSNEKHHSNELRALERRMDESVTISTSNVQSIQARSAGLEELVRNAELAQRSALQVQREELMERVREAANSWSGDRTALDRRLLMVEKTAEDLVERLKMSTSAIEAFFTTSAEGRRLQAAAAKTEVLGVEVGNFKTEVRDAVSAVARLEAQAARKNEFAELRDRISVCELTGDVVKRIENKTTREADEISGLSSKLTGLEQTVASQNNNSKVTTDRVLELETLTAEMSSQVKADSENSSMLAMRLSQLDKTLREELKSATKENSSAASRCNELESTMKAHFTDSKLNYESLDSTVQRLHSSHARLDERIDGIGSRVNGLAISGPAPVAASSPAPTVPARKTRTPSPQIEKPVKKKATPPVPASAAANDDDEDGELFAKAISVASKNDEIGSGRKSPPIPPKPARKKTPPQKETELDISASSPMSEMSVEGPWRDIKGASEDDEFVASAPAPPSQQKETSISSTPFADLSGNNASDLSTAFGDMGSTPHAKADKTSTQLDDDDDEFSPSPAPAPTSLAKESPIAHKKVSKAKVPGLDLGAAARGDGEKEMGALHEPPPKRRGDRDTTIAVSADSTGPSKPSKPSKPTKPAKTPVSSGGSMETPSSTSDPSKMSAKERLKQRIEQKKKTPK